MKKRQVRMKRLNWDSEFYLDILRGTGFIISEPAEVTIDGYKKKSLYGVQSPLYGTNYEDEQSYLERHRCECGAFHSRQFEGEICPLCGTEVKARDNDIKITGWITLGNNKIISPYYYNILQNLIGSNVFNDIVYARYKITKDGRRVKPTEEDDFKPLSIYSGIGVDEFYKKYEEILGYFLNTKGKKSTKKKTYDRLIKEKSSVFISHIPIASTLLRPQSVTSDTFYYNSIDKIINTMFSLSENLKNCVEVERDYILQRLQIKVNAMWDIYFEELHGKDGLIRGEMLGGSLNFTSRKTIDIARYYGDIVYKFFSNCGELLLSLNY